MSILKVKPKKTEYLQFLWPWSYSTIHLPIFGSSFSRYFLKFIRTFGIALFPIHFCLSFCVGGGCGGGVGGFSALLLLAHCFQPDFSVESYCVRCATNKSHLVLNSQTCESITRMHVLNWMPIPILRIEFQMNIGQYTSYRIIYLQWTQWNPWFLGHGNTKTVRMYWLFTSWIEKATAVGKHPKYRYQYCPNSSIANCVTNV